MQKAGPEGPALQTAIPAAERRNPYIMHGKDLLRSAADHPTFGGDPGQRPLLQSLHHAAHATHTAHATGHSAAATGARGLRLVGNECFGGEKQGRDRRCVLQC